jgi:CPA2 family monovalent cation:H+ antiporter-2
METHLLNDILIIFGLSVVVLFFCHRIHVPTIVGFLLTGVLVGPYGFGLIEAVRDVNVLAEIGVVLLLFTIGIEFSFENLLRIKRSVLIGGALQVSMTIALAFFLSTKAGFNMGQALFIGFLVSLSSTAIVLKVLQERADMESPYGQLALAILIFQDIIVVPMMLLIPLLAGATDQGQGSIWILLLKVFGIIVFLIVSAKWIVPYILYQTVRTRSRELFLLSILVICFAIAILTNALGLSLALGAFFAGLIISETEYSHETLGNIIPFKDVFTSMFFVSIGMLMDITYLIHHPFLVLLVALAILFFKSLMTILSVLFLGFPLRIGILTGLSLSQVGEFSFVLFMKGSEYGLLGSDLHQLFLNVVILTMGLTPFIISLSPRVANGMVKLPLPQRLKKGFLKDTLSDGTSRKPHLKDHIIIVGFGLNGKNIAKAARVAKIPYVIIEMNPETVKIERDKGEPIYYGDASQEPVLEGTRVKEARALVVVISDPAATRRIVRTARNMNAGMHIIARTRFITEVNPLFELGASEVIPEEFETSIEILHRILMKYLLPRDEIERLLSEARSDGYGMFRGLKPDPLSFSGLKAPLPEIEISTFKVTERAAIVGQSIGQIQLRAKYGVTLLAVKRDVQTLTNPGKDTEIMAGDLLFVLGTPADLSNMGKLF